MRRGGPAGGGMGGSGGGMPTLPPPDALMRWIMLPMDSSLGIGRGAGGGGYEGTCLGPGGVKAPRTDGTQARLLGLGNAMG